MGDVDRCARLHRGIGGAVEVSQELGETGVIHVVVQDARGVALRPSVVAVIQKFRLVAIGDVVRRVCPADVCLLAVHQHVHRGLRGAVTTDQAVLAEQPDIAQDADRISWYRRAGFGVFCWLTHAVAEQVIQLFVGKTQ